MEVIFRQVQSFKVQILLFQLQVADQMINFRLQHEQQEGETDAGDRGAAPSGGSKSAGENNI
jgi:hypothetical protein